jgi:hypothetical protein
MFGKDFQKNKVFIWIGAIVVFLAALWWQSATILKKGEGFWQTAATAAPATAAAATAAATIDLSGNQNQAPPVSENADSSQLQPLLPLPDQPAFPVITAPGEVRPVDAGSERPTFPAAAKPTGFEAQGPFESYVKLLVNSELSAQGIPVSEGFQGNSIESVVSNIKQIGATKK